MLELDAKLTVNEELINSPNLTEKFDLDELTRIGEYCYQGYYRDKMSRDKWESKMNAAMDLALQIQEAKNFPWPGCSNVVFPLVTIAALQFSARSYSNIIQGTDVVRYRTIGKQDQASKERALRVGKHMSWQVLEEDEAWEEQHDRLLINLAIVGCNFVKTYYNASKGFPVSELVMAKDFVLDYYATSVENCARKTHRFPLYRNDIYERCANGIFRDIRDEPWFNKGTQRRENDPKPDRRSGVNPPIPDEDTPFYLLEQHRWLDLDGDGYAEPYIVTLEEATKCVVRIVSRIESEKDVTRLGNKIVRIKATEYFTKYSFIPSPDGGIYDLGFGVFLGPINEAVNSGINQLIDAGTMQNSLGGFLGRGAKIRGGSYIMAPWEWKRVDSTGDDLKKSIVPFPDREPSDVMFKLLGLLIEYANRVAGTVDPTVGENPGQNTPASTYQGMTESGLQVFGMIFKRVWRCMKEEFKRRYEINAHYLDLSVKFGSGEDFIRKEDYTGSPDQIAPVANPRITSAIMRVTQSTAVKQASVGTSGYDIYEVEKAWLHSMEVEGIDIIYPGPGKVSPEHTFTNPKVAVEQLKVQAIQMKVQAEMQKFANQLLEDQRVNNAEIQLLQAQAAKAATEADAAKAASTLQTFQMLIDARMKMGDMVNKRIQALLGGGSNAGSDGGGVRGLEGPSEHEGDSSVSLKVPGGSQVSVGNGAAK
jgi:chaperonin GroES